MTTATKSLGLLAAVAAGTVPAMPATAADTTATLETRLANEQPLTAADKTFIRDSARSLGLSDRHVDAVFAEYAKGNEKVLLGLPASQETTVTSDVGGTTLPSTETAVAAAAATNPPTGPWNGWNGPFRSPCPARNIGFTVRRDVHNSIGNRLMSFWQHVEAADNCQSRLAPEPTRRHDRSDEPRGGLDVRGLRAAESGLLEVQRQQHRVVLLGDAGIFQAVCRTGLLRVVDSVDLVAAVCDAWRMGLDDGWGTDADPGMHYLMSVNGITVLLVVAVLFVMAVCVFVLVTTPG